MLSLIKLTLRMSPFLTLGLLFNINNAFSASYVECGTEIIEHENDYPTVNEVLLAISSEDEDYSGAVGGTWELKLAKDRRFAKNRGGWIKANKNITAEEVEIDGRTVVVVTIKIDEAASGPVGEQYEIHGIYSETGRADKFTMGGFAGKVKVKSLVCVASNA